MRDGFIFKPLREQQNKIKREEDEAKGRNFSLHFSNCLILSFYHSVCKLTKMSHFHYDISYYKSTVLK